jgi:hypothetical protein
MGWLQDERLPFLMPVMLRGRKPKKGKARSSPLKKPRRPLDSHGTISGSYSGRIHHDDGPTQG